MKILIHLLLLNIVLFIAPIQAEVEPILRDKAIEFTVVDPDGNPVTEACLEASKPGVVKVEGFTDKNGKATLLLAEGASLSIYVSKDGYYQTGGRLWNGGMYSGPGRKLVHRVIPDAFKIELKPIVDPVYMRSHTCRESVPKTAEPAGYDLKTGDWVSPHGTGKTTDILFHFHDINIDGETFSGTLTVRFPNEGDGIQAFTAARPFSMEFGSNLAPPHKAPLDGYLPEISFTEAHRGGESYQSQRSKMQNYLLRTRTRMDANGRILQACYGWIQGEIEFDVRDPAGPHLQFKYYFNPDPDPEARSLEFEQHVPLEFRS